MVTEKTYSKDLEKRVIVCAGATHTAQECPRHGFVGCLKLATFGNTYTKMTRATPSKEPTVSISQHTTGKPHAILLGTRI